MKSFWEREERGGLILNFKHFFQERSDPKHCSTCSTVEDKDSESFRTMAGMLNFRTAFESLGRNFDLSYAVLSIIHLEPDRKNVYLALLGNVST